MIDILLWVGGIGLAWWAYTAWAIVQRQRYEEESEKLLPPSARRKL